MKRYSGGGKEQGSEGYNLHGLEPDEIDALDMTFDQLDELREETHTHAERALMSAGFTMVLAPIFPVAGAVIFPEAVRQIVLLYRSAKKTNEKTELLHQKLKNPHGRQPNP
jgi:hypothetical protein